MAHARPRADHARPRTPRHSARDTHSRKPRESTTKVPRRFPLPGEGLRDRPVALRAEFWPLCTVRWRALSSVSPSRTRRERCVSRELTASVTVGFPRVERRIAPLECSRASTRARSRPRDYPPRSRPNPNHRRRSWNIARTTQAVVEKSTASPTSSRARPRATRGKRRGNVRDVRLRTPQRVRRFLPGSNLLSPATLTIHLPSLCVDSTTNAKNTTRALSSRHDSNSSSEKLF